MALGLKINNISFNNLTDVCSYYGIPKSNIEKYIADEDISEEDAINKYIKENKMVGKQGNSEGLILKGVYYPSFHSACKAYNVPYSSSYTRRYVYGWSLEEVFLGAIDVKKLERKSYIIFGEEYPSLNAVCKKFNVKSDTVNKYVKKYGITVAEFIENIGEYISSKRNSYVVEGVSYITLQDVCNAYSKDYNKVYRRVHKGWSIEEAIDLVKREVKNKPKEYIVRGRVFKSKSEMCSHYNISTDGFNGRIKKGWTVEEALGLVDKKDYLIVDGKKFESKVAISAYYKINRGTLIRRTSKGYSLEEAIGLFPRVDSGIIVKDSYSICSSVRILSYVANNYYKCKEDGRIKYYSKDELFKIRRKAFEEGERF